MAKWWRQRRPESATKHKNWRNMKIEVWMGSNKRDLRKAPIVTSISGKRIVTIMGEAGHMGCSWKTMFKLHVHAPIEYVLFGQHLRHLCDTCWIAIA